MSFEINKIKHNIEKLVDNHAFNIFITVCIFINSVLIGIQETPTFYHNSVLNVIDKIFLFIFCVEIILKFIAYGKIFFIDKWNIFDSLIVLISVIFELSNLLVFRSLGIFKILRTAKAYRVIRVARIFPNIKNLQKIVTAISRALPKILTTLSLLAIIFYIYAILGISIYNKPDCPNCSEYFGSFKITFYTLFQIMTEESWASGIARNLDATHPSIWLYSISFIIISSLTILSVITGVIVESISEVSKEFDKGISLYNNTNHIVIIGFNEVALYLIKQINSYEKKSFAFSSRKKILILDDGDIDLVKLTISESLGKNNYLHIDFCKGKGDNTSDLEKCNIENAKSVIVNHQEETKLVRTLLSIKAIFDNNENSKKISNTQIFTVVDDFELYNQLKTILESVKRFHILSSQKLITLVLANSCRKAGFPDIFKELFTSSDNEIYIKTLPLSIYNANFGDVALSYNNATMLGFIRDEKVFLNPSKNEKMKKNDKGIFIAEDKNSILYKKNKKNKDLNINWENKIENKKNIKGKKIVFVGCNQYLENTIQYLNDFVSKNSEVMIYTTKEEKIEKEKELNHSKYKNISVKWKECKDKFDINELYEIIKNGNIVLVFFTNSNIQSNEADSVEMLNLLITINKIKTEAIPNIRILCQMQNIENQKIAPKKNEYSNLLTGLEYVVGNSLTSNIMAQFALDYHLHEIYEDLLTIEGNKIYLTEVDNIQDKINNLPYGMLKADFSKNHDREILIGFKDNQGEIHLNPDKSKVIDKNIDELIVIKEGE